MNTNSQLGYKNIFVFWYPLAITWLMMCVEGPFLTAVVARQDDPKINLAAYGVAFSIAIIVEAPIIMIMSASIALVQNRLSYFKLRNFTFFLNFIITAAMIILLVSPAMKYLAVDIIKLPDSVAKLTVNALIIMIPWPAAIGFRRFYQGILINDGQTKKVAIGTITRLFSIGITGFLLLFFVKIQGTYLATIALCIAVTTEAIVTRLMASGAIKRVIEKTDQSKDITYSQIIKFYYPLAMTSLLAMGVHPMVSFFLGRSQMPIESLAVLPVITTFVFIFRGTFGLSFQEISIALLSKNKTGKHKKNYDRNHKKIRNFAFILGFISTLILCTIAFTPLAKIWFEKVSGLSATLAQFAILPLIVLSIFPALSVLMSWQRAIQITAKQTSAITIATTIEVSATILIMYWTINSLNMTGVLAATLALVAGRLLGNSYLAITNKAATKKIASIYS